MITEKKLRDLQWNNFSIMDFKDGKIVLILLADTEEKSIQLLELFYDFDLMVYINETTGIIGLDIAFNNSEFNIRYDTGKTVEDYFPLTWLLEKKVNYLTTGYKNEDGQIFFNKNLYPLT